MPVHWGPWRRAAVVVTVVAFLAAIGVLWTLQERRVDEASVKIVDAQPGDSAPEGTDVSPEYAALPDYTALFVGDSYTAGGGGIESNQTFTAQFCWAWRWHCWRDAQGGTGYLASGQANSPKYRPFIDRIAGVKKSLGSNRPDPYYIFVAGGRNDYAKGSEKDAAVAYFESLHAAFPTSRIVALEPFFTTGTLPSSIVGIRADVKAAAAATGVKYIPTANWLAPSDMGPDHVHPSIAGHGKMARHLEEWLTEDGAGSLIRN